MGEMDFNELDDLLGKYVFSANFDGDAAEEMRSIHEWVKSAILAERQRCADVTWRYAGTNQVAASIADAILNPH